MEARYRFVVTFRVAPTVEEVSISPVEFETTLYYRAVRPGEDGWRFFRDNLWRGEVNDHADFRDRTADALDVTVTRVEFRGLETDAEYLEALRKAIADSLVEFKADSVDEVVTKYLGSKVQVCKGEPTEC
ncbi:MAG: LWR-salt protein [Halobacteriales archaeon]|nr:LWR-salt protein [Halobacteriales archaeon]